MASKIAIVGGGLSGLASAWLLSHDRRAAGAEIVVLEANRRWGGIVLTESRGDFLFEAGPDSLVAHKPDGPRLCKDLGLEGDLIGSRPSQRGAWVWLDGALRAFPMGVLMRAPIPGDQLLRSGLLSEAGRRRIGEEPRIPASQTEDESVADFVRRRLGEEALERIAEPLVSGVYGGQVERISMRSAFPALFEAERRDGSVVRFESNGQPPPQTSESPFVTLRGGVGRLIDRLVEDLSGRVQLRSGEAVEKAEWEKERYRLTLAGGERLQVDGLMLAVPAPAAARILKHGWPRLAEALGEIEYSPTIVGCLAFDRDVTTGRRGAGLLIPRCEAMQLMACTWVHHKFEGRCPPGRALLRCFIGSRQAERLMESGQEELLGLMRGELREVLGVQDAPCDAKVYRWRAGLPQYAVGHWRRVRRIETEIKRLPRFACIGNYFDGVGLSDCVRHARRAVESLAQKLDFEAED